MWDYGWSLFIDAIEASREFDLEQAGLTALAIISALGGKDPMTGHPLDFDSSREGYPPYQGLDGDALMRKMGKWKKQAGDSNA